MTRVLRVKDLEVCFATTEGTVQVLDGVSFDIRKGEVLGVVERVAAERALLPCPPWDC